MTQPLSRLALTLVLALWALAPAQNAAGDQAPVMDEVAVISEGPRVSLRWSLPDGAFPEGGFTVERTAPDGTLTTIPVPSPRPWEELVAAAGDGEPVISAEGYRAVQELFDAESVRQAAESDTGLTLLRAFYTLEIAINPDLAAALGLLFHDDDVLVGQRYSYEVFTGGGRRVGAAAITAGSTPPLSAPSGLRATPSGAGIDLIWDRPAEEDLVFAYRVWSGAAGAGELTPLTEDWFTLPLPAAEGDPEDAEASSWYRDESRAPGSNVAYTVVGRDLFGRETPPSLSVVAVVPDPRGLPQPLVVGAEVGDLTITLDWALETDERVVAVGVLRSRGQDVPPVLVSPLLDPSQTSWTDEGLFGGVDYYYAVAAFDATGRAAVGPTWVQRAVNPNGPDAVNGLRLKPAETAMLLSWNAPQQPDVGRYQVYAARPGTPFEEMTLLGETWATTFSAPIPTNTLFDVAYRVRAVNTSDVPGAVSAEVSGRPLDLTPPSAPLWAAVVGEEELVALDWLRDLDPDVSYLRLWRAAPDVEFELLADQLAPSTTSYRDTAAVAGVSYRYALQAVDAAGNESPLSAVMTAAAWSLAPAAPASNLTAELLDGGGVRLSWDAAEPGVGWVVSKLANGSWVEVSDLLSAPSFVDLRGTRGASYRVTSYSSTGQAGEPVAVTLSE